MKRLQPIHRSILLLFVLACSWASAAWSAPKDPVVALVGPVKSPLLKELSRLGPFVRPGDPLASLLVLDGDAFSGTMADKAVIRKAWRAGKALLVLDGDESDLKGDLIRLTGIVPSKGMGAVYLRKRRDGGVDQVLLSMKGTSIGPSGRLRRQQFFRHLVTAFRDELPVVIYRPTPDNGGPQAESSKGTNTPSAFRIGPFPIDLPESESISASWFNRQASGQAWPLPSEGATVNLSDQVTVMGSGSFGGQQEATAYIVFQGNGNSSVQSFDQITGPSVGMTTYLINGYANPQQQRTVALTLDTGSFELSQVSPANTAGQATVSSGFKFSLEVGPEGPTADLDFSHETETPLQGWTVTQSQSPTQDSVTWIYQEQLDANGNNMTEIYSSLFAENSANSPNFGIYAPSELATSLVQSAPMVVWITQESEGAQSAEVTSTISGANTYWVREDPFIGTSGEAWYLGTSTNAGDLSNLTVTLQQPVTISLAELWNQMGYLSSVEVPSTVTAGTQMPVTVTLDHPAPQAGMPVTLASNAPGIIPPQSQLLVLAGNDSATFQIPVLNTGSGEVTLTFTVNGLPMNATTTVVPSSTAGDN